jgi:hypothetical protein
MVNSGGRFEVVGFVVLVGVSLVVAVGSVMAVLPQRGLRIWREHIDH